MRATPLTITHPHLIQEWHPRKNNVSIEQVSKGSTRLVWWLGECNHEWEASPASRSRDKASSCPYCSGRKAIPGVNDFTVEHPLLAAQWHPTLNSELDPTTFKSGSQKAVWWRGECGHEWEAMIRNRVRGSGCHICTGKAVVAGINDLQTLNPKLAKFWDYSNNGDMTPLTITDKSEKLVHWICEDGHEWAKSPSRMLGVQRICPVCNNRKALKDYNDLAHTHPLIAAQWDHVANDVLLSDVTANMDAMVWWLCDKGHSSKTSVASKVKGYGCTICANRTILPGYNDLATTEKEVAQEWHPTKNGDLTPAMISRGANKKIWWLCEKGHEWIAKSVGRTYGKSGCPQCASAQRVSQGEQELADYITNLGFDVIQSNRKLLDGLELDIYIPEKKLAIEYNGLYWHSEVYKNDNDHYEKWQRAKSKGIQLLQIWEDQWVKSESVVKHVLNLSLSSTSTTQEMPQKPLNVTVVSPAKAKEFLEKYDLEGFIPADCYYALVNNENNEIFGVLGVNKEVKYGLTIIRYATKYNIPDGFTQLLQHMEQKLQPNALTIYTDNCISNGELYKSHGFIADCEISPDYRYIVNNQRKLKQNYDIERFKNDPNLLWEENIPLEQLITLNKITRIWDAGKIRWTKHIKQ